MSIYRTDNTATRSLHLACMFTEKDETDRENKITNLITLHFALRGQLLFVSEIYVGIFLNSFIFKLNMT